MKGKPQRAVFLDRDGVLNHAIVRGGNPYPPASVSELEIVTEAPECLLALKRLGLMLIVVTNQPDVARGKQPSAAVEEIHRALGAVLPVDAFLTCFHDDGDNCECRKPRPGLLLEAASRYALELAESFLIGDRWRDIDAGYAAGCKTILIDYGYAERRPSAEPDARVFSLRQAVEWIARQVTKGGCVEITC